MGHEIFTTVDTAVIGAIIFFVLAAIVLGSHCAVKSVKGESCETGNKTFATGSCTAMFWLVVTLIAYPYLLNGGIDPNLKHIVVYALPISAVVMGASFWLACCPCKDSKPNCLINLYYPAALVQCVCLVIVGVGILL